MTAISYGQSHVMQDSYSMWEISGEKFRGGDISQECDYDNDVLLCLVQN